MTRPITGTVYKPNGAAWAGGEVRARLIEPFETSTRVYPKFEVTITLDSNGKIPDGTQLDTPDTGTAHYLITTPDQANYEVYLATGPSVDLVILLTIAGTAVDPDPVQTALDAAALLPPTDVTAEYTVLAADKMLVLDGTFPVHFPVTTASGRLISGKNNGAGNITLTPNGAETIDGYATVTIGPLGFFTLYDGEAGNWLLFGA